MRVQGRAAARCEVELWRRERWVRGLGYREERCLWAAGLTGECDKEESGYMVRGTKQSCCQAGRDTDRGTVGKGEQWIRGPRVAGEGTEQSCNQSG